MKNVVDNRSGVSSTAECAGSGKGLRHFGFSILFHLNCSGANRIYSPIEDMCIEVMTTTKPWPKADSTCKIRGGRLIVADSERKFNFIKTTLQESAVWRTTNYWIGLSDEPVANGIFIWSDGTRASYTNWIPGEGKSATEFCVEMVRSRDYQWNDNPCWAPLRFICEYT
ncbi:C-type lectin-like [Haliotis rubra]|uniref:C-type lectin-like n=1 Tax=Haliotis rubra TaxID=36100 RepID=UPI001EE522E2|nr:C-type lectin-like [Haliotis rubra]